MGPLNGCYVRIKKHPVRWVNPLKIIVEISRNYHASVLTLHSEMKDPWTSKICIQTPPPPPHSRWCWVEIPFETPN